MAYNLIRAGRLMVIALAAYAAAGCGASIQERNPPETAVPSTSAPSPERLAAVQLRVGRTAFDQGSVGTALDLFEKAHKTAPEAAAPLVGKGDALFAQRRFPEAETAYRAALVRDSSSFEAQEGLGKTLVTLQKFEDGLHAFEAARTIRADASLLNKIGVTHELLGNGTAAQIHFREALALDRKSLTARNNLALSLAVSGSYDAAMSEMEQVVSSSASSERHHANLAFIYGLAGRPLDRAPAQVLRAAANKGWDAAFFARTREIAKSGDRVAILDLLNNRAPRDLNLPEMPEMPEMPESASDIPVAAPADTATIRPIAAQPVEIPAPPPAPVPAPVMPETAKIVASESAAPVISADAAATAAVIDWLAANLMAAPKQAAEPETPAQASVVALVVPSPPPAPPPAPTETAVPAPPPAPTETAVPAPSPPPPPATASVPPPPPAPTQTTAETGMETQATPVRQLAMLAPEITPAAEPATSATPAPERSESMAPPEGAYRVQLGAYPTRWLGRALRILGGGVGDLLPANRVEVVRGARFHTLRSTSIAKLGEARQICFTLRSRDVECFVTLQSRPPAGQGLDITGANDADAMAAFLAGIEPIPPVADQDGTVPDKTATMPHPTINTGSDTGKFAAPGEYRLQFAAYRHAKYLARGLDVLRKKAGDALPAIESLVRSESLEGTTIPYRLRSAPLESRAAAAELCKSLAEKGVECLVIRHGAQAWLPLS